MPLSIEDQRSATRPSPIRQVMVVAVLAMWIALGIPVGLVSAVTPASASTVPACTGSNFMGGLVGTNGATGTSIYQVALINYGHASCRLAGYPTVQGYRNGREYQLRVFHLKDQPFALYPTTVGPQMSAEMVFTTSALCNALNVGGQTVIKKVMAENTYTVSIKFPHFNVPVDIFGLSLDVTCGLDITVLGWR